MELKKPSTTKLNLKAYYFIQKTKPHSVYTVYILLDFSPFLWIKNMCFIQ